MNFKLEAKIMAFFLPGLAIIGGAAALILPRIGAGTLHAIILSVGFYFFLKAKISEKQRNLQTRDKESRAIWMSFGAANMTRKESIYYYAGYALMAFGVLSAVLLSRGFKG